MCGIVGQITDSGTMDTAALQAALELMRPRGPDDSGVARFSSGILGHRRLRIIDAAGSPQPWQSEDGRYTIVYNGEIYNYLELREQLEQEGLRFRTRGDTEVLLQAYILHGKECLALLNGMFAFAIWDEWKKSLFAARDRMGEKPFYYMHNGSDFIFASQLQAFRCYKHIDSSLNYTALNQYFANQFVSGPETIYKNIHQLRPAHYLYLKDGRLAIHPYWTLPLPGETEKNLADLTEEFFALLDTSVRLRLRSDVPLGVFLSGGLDSASIAAMMRQHVTEVDSFTIRFDQDSFDESREAQISSTVLGTQHHVSAITPNLVDDLPKMIAAVGEPFGDTSMVPAWYLCQATRQNVTVALSGDGADEILGGYKRYLASRIFEQTAWFPYTLLDKLIGLWPDTTEYYGKSWAKKIRLFLQFRDRHRHSPGDLAPQVFLQSERRKLFDPDFYHELHRDDIATFQLRGLSPTEQFLYMDSVRYLPDDILVKVDRMSMAHSLEVRTPFLDHTLVEFCASLPIRFKIRHLEQKYLLKEAVRKLLPREVVKRPKHGFAAPVGDLLKNGLREYFAAMVLDRTDIPFLNAREISRLWQDHLQGKRDNGMKLWTILIFFGWYEQAGVQ